jgi:hypothetical protein
MANGAKRKFGGLKEFVSGALVVVFTILGLAALADRLESNVTQNAVADTCGGTGKPACNQATGNAIQKMTSKRV